MSAFKTIALVAVAATAGAVIGEKLASGPLKSTLEKQSEYAGAIKVGLQAASATLVFGLLNSVF